MEFSHPIPVLVQTSVALLAATTSTVVRIAAWFGLKEIFGTQPLLKAGLLLVRLLRIVSKQVWTISIFISIYLFPPGPSSLHKLNPAPPPLPSAV